MNLMLNRITSLPMQMLEPAIAVIRPTLASVISVARICFTEIANFISTIFSPLFGRVSAYFPQNLVFRVISVAQTFFISQGDRGEAVLAPARNRHLTIVQALLALDDVEKKTTDWECYNR